MSAHIPGMTLIPLSPAGDPPFESPHDYGTAHVQGGRGGLVIRPGGGSYRTAFVEAFLGEIFVRGEGATLAEADDACWEQVQACLACAEHQWEPCGYRNGGGVCARCGQFGARVFTAAQLGLTCTTCGVPTFNTTRGTDGAEPRCEQHDPLWPYFVAHLGAMRRHDPESTAMYRRLSDVANYGAPADQEALDWAYANVDMSSAPR